VREPELAQEQARVQALVQEQVREPEQAQVQVQELAPVRVLEQVQAPEPAQVQEPVQELVRASVDAYRPAPKQDRAPAAVITPRHGIFASAPGRSTSRRMTPATCHTHSRESSILILRRISSSGRLPTGIRHYGSGRCSMIRSSPSGSKASINPALMLWREGNSAGS
jgi:hypothetical protein